MRLPALLSQPRRAAPRVTEAGSGAPSRRSRAALAWLAVALVAVAAVAVQRQGSERPPFTGVLALDADPVVRVDPGRYTYSTALRSIATTTLTVEEIVPLGRGARPVTRAFAKRVGDPDPPDTGGEYAPSALDVTLGPGREVRIVIVGVPDCADPQPLVGIRVLVRRNVATETVIVAPPRVSDPGRELAGLAERACR